MKKLFTALRPFWAVTATVLLVLAPVAQAQTTFYISQDPAGLGGIVDKVAPDGTVTTPFVTPGGSPQGITTDALGNVYVGHNTTTGTITAVTPGGVSSTYANYTQTIGGIQMSSDGTIYGVADPGTGGSGASVGTFAANGTFTPLTINAAYSFPFYSAATLAFNTLDTMYVSNSSFGGAFPHSVVKLTLNGGGYDAAIFKQYPSDTSYQPYGLALDLSGNVYIGAATTTNTIEKYNSAGVQDGSFTISGVPAGTPFRGLTFADNNLYAVDGANFHLWEINPDTGAATQFQTGFLSTHLGQFVTSHTIPEPSESALLMLGGLALLAVTRRRTVAVTR